VRYQKKRSTKGGTNTVELAPALFILIIVILIPIMDMLFLIMSYTAGWYLNHLCTRECAVHDPTQAAEISSAVQIADSTWKKSMLCGLAQATGAASQEQVTYVDASNNKYVSNLSTNGSGTVSGTAVPAPSQTPATPPVPPQIITCQVITTLPIKPLFVVPFIGSVPGLSAPVVMTYSGQRPQEEKGIK
jgi:hypothetical protein